jgi:hypothetical protein
MKRDERAGRSNAMPAATAKARPTDPVKKIMATTLAVVDAGDSLRSIAPTSLRLLLAGRHAGEAGD